VTGPLQVLLDTSAVVAYSRESINVGEVLAEVADENGSFGIPVTCLAAGAIRATRRGRLELLISQPGCVVLPDLRDDWRPLALGMGIVGRLDLAAVLLAVSRTGDPSVLSAEPRAYAAAGDAITVIEV
jgi:hypothetical protein